MKIYVPRAGQGPTGLIIPADRFDGQREGLAILVAASERRAMSARAQQVSRHHGASFVGSMSSDTHTLIAVNIPNDTEMFFEALGVSSRAIRQAENAVDLSQKGILIDLWERGVERAGFSGPTLHPRLIGQNLSGKDVFERAFGRTFSDGNSTHAEWEAHKDGKLKGQNGRASLFLHADDANDWKLLARTAVAMASLHGRVSQAEIDGLLSAGVARGATQPNPANFREMIEAEMAEVVARGFVRGRESAVKLSIGLPPFAERDGTKLTLAQFSTPPAIGQLASEFLVGKHKAQRILEPTVGNGLMVAAAVSAGASVVGFEIDGDRAGRAKSALGGNTSISTVNATEALTSMSSDVVFDGVIANPPFGNLGGVEQVKLNSVDSSFAVRTLDTKIAVMSLDKLRVGGSAVLVMPAEIFNPSELDGGRKKQQVLFERMFESVHSIAIDAKLYKSMGANTPVLVHFLGGKREALDDLEAAVGRSKSSVEVMGSFDELYDWADGALSLGRSADPRQEVRPPNHTAQPKDAPDADTGIAAEPEAVEEAARGPLGAKPSDPAPATTNVPPESPVAAPDPVEAVQTGPVNAAPAVSEDLEAAQWYDDDIDDDAFTRPYIPFSSVGQGSVVIQKTLQGPVYRALKSVQDEVGDIDDYVCNGLGIDRDELMKGEILSPEQVDSIALGLYRRANGEAMIIGDKMGVGKGRQLAALALSALRNGQPVLFTTLDPTLFTDFASRDLRDVSGRPIDSWIDSGEMRPFIFNPTPDASLRNDLTGESVFHTSAAERNLAKKLSRIDPTTNLALLTYSQLQTETGHWRLQAILSWLEENAAKKPLLLLDEIHKAAGVDSRTGVWMQSIINKAREVGGDVVYSSATSMKSGKNIVVYSAALPDTGISTADLMTLMEQNPLSMQEVLSAEMASSGRLIEREMSSAGIEREMVQLADLSDAKMNYAREATDLAADFLAELVDIAPTLKDVAKTIATAKFGGSMLNGQDKTVDVTTTSPVSQFDNYSRYLMLAVKGLFAEELLMKSIAKGEKPTIVVDSTADTLTGWVSSQSNHLDGRIDAHPNIGHVLKRNASRLLDVRIETAMGDSETVRLTQYEGWLSDYSARVDEFDWSRMRINVLDLVGEVCEANGLTFKDITKRSLSVIERDGQFFVERREPVTKADAIKEYGSGITDVLGLNKGAATGLSAHASRAIGPDVRRRAMIPLQFQKDITDQRQVEGRINRFAQVSAPIYYTPSTGFAADERLANLFNRANRNLTSSTSASRENATNIEGIDLLNPVGDMAVASFAKNNPEIADKLDLDPKGQDLGRKLLGRIVCLPLDKQEAVLAEVDTIFSLFMEKLTREGRNPLRLAHFNWKANVETISVLVDGRDNATALADQPVYLNRATFTEHVRWETTQQIGDRVLGNVERAGDRADPSKFLSLDHIKPQMRNATGFGYNFDHDIFKEARHGGSAAGSEFRNIDPALVGRLHGAWVRSERESKVDGNRSRREIASDIFLDRMKYECETSPDSPAAKAWERIRGIESTSQRSFNPGRYMLPISRAVERADQFFAMRNLLKPGLVVGIRAEAISDFMQGEFGKALTSVGEEGGIIPAVITAVRFPKDEVGTASNWHVSFVAAGSQGYFGTSLSSMNSGLEFSGNAKEGESPIVPFQDFTSWMNRSPKASDVLAKVYGDRWNGVAREIAEAAQEIRTEGVSPEIHTALGYRLFSTVNDNVPSGTRLRERFVLEGNLFAGLQLVQSGKKAEGEKAVFTDQSGTSRHAIVLSEINTEDILDNLTSKSQHNGLLARDLSNVARMQAYLELVGVIHMVGRCVDLPEHSQAEAIKRFSDALYDWDKEAHRAVAQRLEDDPASVMTEVAMSIGNAAEDLPFSLSIGGDPWRWFYDVGSRSTRGRHNPDSQRQMYPATMEVIENSGGFDTYSGPFTIHYDLDQSALKMGLEGLSQTSVVAASAETGRMSFFYKKTNPLIKDNPDFKELISDSSDSLDDMKLPKGLLCRTFDLYYQPDVVQLSNILSSIAKTHQNEVILNGGGKRIYGGLNKLAEKITTEQTAEHNAGLPNIAPREGTADASSLSL